MNLRIHNINFNTIKFQDINHKKQSNQTKYTTNSTLLPNYEYYKSLSFGKNIQELPPEDFLLPASCKPDKYQIDAAQALAKGNNTIVTAPTGTGKTAIANYAIKRNFEKGQKTFYTTPLKALSNQKYNDLKAQFGKENVGIMTGDRKENTDAPIIVMTTEIYRNMVASDYFGKKNDALNNLKTVIFDEFHYMGDPDRGSVWEESIMFSPNNIQILALSATVGNNKKIASWIGATKPQQATLVNVPPENRHVPLEFIMYNPEDRATNNIKHQSHLNMRYFTKAYYDSRMTDTQINALNTLSIKMGFKPNNRGRKNVVEILRDEYRLNTVDIKEVQEFLNYEYKIPPEESHPLLLRLTDKKAEPSKWENGRIVASTVLSRRNPMTVIKLTEKLKETNKLPAITFVFSKKFSEELLNTAEKRGKVLTTSSEQEEIKKVIQKYQQQYDFYSNNLNIEALLKGYAIHSAAILPLQKQLIEELFNKKLIKVVFATETLAAGINLPARSVIMTDYQKPNGGITSEHAKFDFLRPLSANEFHQMSGRAGRRGIDKIGYVYLLNDSPEKEAQFEKLIHSDANSISSALKIDASFVTSFFSYLSDPKDMTRILAKSFSLYEPNKENKEIKLKNNMQYFKEYTDLLSEYGFLKEVSGGYTTTIEGELINDLKGKPQIPIIKAILDNQFDKASPKDIAGLIAAIAANPNAEDKTLSPIYKIKSETENELLAINTELNDILEKYMCFSPDYISANHKNDEILNAIESKFGHILKKDFDLIQQQRDTLNKLIKEEEQDLKQHFASEQFQSLNKLKNHAERLRQEKHIIRQTERIKLLLNRRLAILAQKELEKRDDETTKYNIYNSIRKLFIAYNDKAELTDARIPQISLNQTAFLLVNKWAELNSISDDYKSNWDEVCNLLQDIGAIKYEGDLFNAISQTIDFLNQIVGMLENAEKLDFKLEQKEKFNQLRIKCKEAVKLLKTPPLYPSEEI